MKGEKKWQERMEAVQRKVVKRQKIYKHVALDIGEGGASEVRGEGLLQKGKR